MTSEFYVEVFHAKDGWRWRKKSSGNHEIVATSGEGFTEHRWALESATEHNPETPIVDVDG